MLCIFSLSHRLAERCGLPLLRRPVVSIIFTAAPFKIIDAVIRLVLVLMVDLIAAVGRIAQERLCHQAMHFCCRASPVFRKMYVEIPVFRWSRYQQDAIMFHRFSAATDLAVPAHVINALPSFDGFPFVGLIVPFPFHNIKIIKIGKFYHYKSGRYLGEKKKGRHLWGEDSSDIRQAL